MHSLRTPAHIGIATRCIDDALAALGSRPKSPTALDLRLWTPSGPASWTLQRVYTRMGSAIIELLSGSPGTIWHTTAVLDFHHYAYWSNDLSGDVERLVADGWQCEASLVGADGRVSGFAYLTPASAPRVELIASDLRASPSPG